MRIIAFIAIMGFSGLIVLLMLPDIRQSKVTEVSPPYRKEKVNASVRDVTPDNTLPGPDINSTSITRLPDIVVPPVSEPEPATKIWRNALVKTAGEFSVGDVVLQISGVKPLPLEKFCPTKDGVQWPCGRFARTAMRGLVRNRPIECAINAKNASNVKCKVGGRDIGQWLVKQGWAHNAGGGYENAMKTAKKMKFGMWRDDRP